MFYAKVRFSSVGHDTCFALAASNKSHRVEGIVTKLDGSATVIAWGFSLSHTP